MLDADFVRATVQVRYDQLIGDTVFVYAPPGSVPAQKAFSALVHALLETERAAIVRYLTPPAKTPKIPEPRVGLMTAHIDPINAREYAQWTQVCCSFLLPKIYQVGLILDYSFSYLLQRM